MLRVAVGTVHGWSTDAMLMAISIPEQVFVLKPLNPVLTDSGIAGTFCQRYIRVGASS